LQFDHYLIAAVLGSLVVGGAALPLLVAAVVAWWPGQRPSYKVAFVITASVLVLGVAGLVSLLSLPFELFGTYVSPQLEHGGHKAVPRVNGWLFTATNWLPMLVVALGSVLIPIMMRRQLWARLCEVMANKPLQPIARENARSG
jgi:hypothetical protein